MSPNYVEIILNYLEINRVCMAYFFRLSISLERNYQYLEIRQVYTRPLILLSKLAKDSVLVKVHSTRHWRHLWIATPTKLREPRRVYAYGRVVPNRWMWWKKKIIVLFSKKLITLFDWRRMLRPQLKQTWFSRYKCFTDEW